MSAWYFTFSYSAAVRNHYVRIEAENFWRARERMIEIYGTAWTMQHSEAEFARLPGSARMQALSIEDLHCAVLHLAGRHHAAFAIARVSAQVVWIVDEDGDMSVTNDAEQVVRTLVQRYGERRIVYRDSDGAWDELLHRGERFTGYAPAREMAL